MTWRRRGFFCLKVAACYFKLAIANTPEDELAATLWNDTHELFEYNFEDFGFDFLDLPSPAPTHKRKLIDDESYFVPNRHSHNCDQDGLNLVANTLLSHPREPNNESTHSCISSRESSEKDIYSGTRRTAKSQRVDQIDKSAKVDQKNKLNTEEAQVPDFIEESEKDSERAFTTENVNDRATDNHSHEGKMRKNVQLALGPDVLKLITSRAKRALSRQASEDAEASKQLQTRLAEKFKNVEQLFESSCAMASSRQIKGLPVLVGALKESPDDNHHQNTWIRLIEYDLLNKRGRVRRKQHHEYKIGKIWAGLNSIHNLVSLNGLDDEILGKSENHHKECLEWFEGLLFKNTDGHVPLLGEVQVSSSENISKESFSHAQIYLARVTTDSSIVEQEKARVIALNLLEFWYEEEFRKINKFKLSKERYFQLISQAVRPYTRFPLPHSALPLHSVDELN